MRVSSAVTAGLETTHPPNPEETPHLNLLKMTEPWSNSKPELSSSVATTEASPKLGGLRPISLQLRMMCFP